MEVKIALNLDETRKMSWQDDFPKTVKCVKPKCNGEARLAFVAHEFNTKPHKEKYICDLYENDPEGEGYWVHDSCAVAVYLCKKCLEPKALCNQG